MYCRNCGNEVDPNAAICVQCGYAKNNGDKFCQNCGKEVESNASVCLSCGYAIKPAVNGEQKSKIVAGLLGIFLGGLGIHNFYLGFTGKAIAQIILTVLCLGIGAIWGLIEGIMILAGSINKDAAGNPLGD